jgi:hypothetical protein
MDDTQILEVGGCHADADSPRVGQKRSTSPRALENERRVLHDEDSRGWYLIGPPRRWTAAEAFAIAFVERPLGQARWMKAGSVDPIRPAEDGRVVEGNAATPAFY